MARLPTLLLDKFFNQIIRKIDLIVFVIENYEVNRVVV